MTETKLPRMVINRIDSEDTYQKLIKAGQIGENDISFVESEDTSVSLGLTGASVGDIIKVKAVDDSGKPTEWEAANSAVEIANGVDVSAVSSFEYSVDLAGNAIKSNHLKLVLSAPNVDSAEKWLRFSINDITLSVICYFNNFWVCDIQILKEFIYITLGKSDFNSTYAWESNNKCEHVYVIATTTDNTNLDKTITCLYGGTQWGESAKLWIWGE